MSHASSRSSLKYSGGKTRCGYKPTGIVRRPQWLPLIRSRINLNPAARPPDQSRTSSTISCPDATHSAHETCTPASGRTSGGSTRGGSKMMISRFPVIRISSHQSSNCARFRTCFLFVLKQRSLFLEMEDQDYIGREGRDACT